MSYGAPPPPPSAPYGGSPYGGQPAAGTNQKAIWALVTGILSVTCCGLFTAIPAVILGNMARKETSTTGQGGRGLATAGLVLGIISLVLSVIYLLLVVSGVIDFTFSADAD
jgi:hypothetical protein